MPATHFYTAAAVAAARNLRPRPAMSLDIFQLALIHPEIVAQFVDDGTPDFVANFGLAGAHRFDVFMIKHDVIRPGRQVKRSSLWLGCSPR
jgi:hypothetical protein